MSSLLKLNELSNNAAAVLNLYREEKLQQMKQTFGREVYIISDKTDPTTPMFKVVTKGVWAFGRRPRCSENQSVNKVKVLKALTTRLREKPVAKEENKPKVVVALELLGKVPSGSNLTTSKQQNHDEAYRAREKAIKVVNNTTRRNYRIAILEHSFKVSKLYQKLSEEKQHKIDNKYEPIPKTKSILELKEESAIKDLLKKIKKQEKAMQKIVNTHASS